MLLKYGYIRRVFLKSKVEKYYHFNPVQKGTRSKNANSYDQIPSKTFHPSTTKVLPKRDQTGSGGLANCIATVAIFITICRFKQPVKPHSPPCRMDCQD